MQYIIAFLTLLLTTFYVATILKKVKGRRKWIYFEIIYNCFIKFFIAYMHLPSSLNYVTDIILVILVIYELPRFKSTKAKEQYGRTFYLFCFTLALFSISAILSYISNDYSFLLFLWGIRNNIRFLIFAFICSKSLKRQDIETIIDILVGYFTMNILAVTYEYFFTGSIARTGDSISGLYSMGMERGGGNGSLNWLLCIICIYAIAKYLNKEKNIAFLAYTITASIYMAMLSELKAFFVELVFFIIIETSISKKTFKTIAIGFGGIVGIFIGIQGLYYFFPKFADFYRIDTILSYLGPSSGYQGLGTINRISSLEYVVSHFLHSASELVFGIGLGNADYSSFGFLKSSFYINNSWTLYYFFYAPFLFIETGVLGLASFLMIFFSYLYGALKMKIIYREDLAYKVIAITLALLSIVMLFYNQTLKIETIGYMVQLLLTIPFVMTRDCSGNTRSLFRRGRKK